MRFIKHDEKGEILFCGEVPDSMFHLQGDDVIEGEADSRYHYVLNGKVLAKSISPVEYDGVLKLTNIPIGANLVINGQVYTINDGYADLEFTYPSKYKIEVNAFPYLPLNLEIVV